MSSVAKVVRVRNEVRGSTLASNARVADRLTTRLMGLMFSERLQDVDSFGERDALLIEPCNSIHMCFMRYPIDVVFIDANDEVVGQIEDIKPWRFTKIYWNARKALELPVGRIAETDTRVGDTLSIQSVVEA